MSKDQPAPTNQEVLSDLQRAKCAFQLRTIAHVMRLTEADAKVAEAMRDAVERRP